MKCVEKYDLRAETRRKIFINHRYLLWNINYVKFPWLFRNFPDFQQNSKKNSLTNSKIPWPFLDLEFPWLFSDQWQSWDSVNKSAMCQFTITGLGGMYLACEIAFHSESTIRDQCTNATIVTTVIWPQRWVSQYHKPMMLKKLHVYEKYNGTVWKGQSLAACMPHIDKQCANFCAEDQSLNAEWQRLGFAWALNDSPRVWHFALARRARMDRQSCNRSWPPQPQNGAGMPHRSPDPQARPCRTL